MFVVDEFAGTAWDGIVLRIGSWYTGLTVNAKLLKTLLSPAGYRGRPWSVTVTVMMAGPPARFGRSDIWNWLAGILATWLVKTVSPNSRSIFALGITVGLPLVTVISRFVTTVSTYVN